jgi:hypothetical protein
MGHCIHAIVARLDVTKKIRGDFPQLLCAHLPQDFGLIPIEAEFVDSVTSSTVPQNTEEFMLLTPGFHAALIELSRLGRIAYVETEYFGGSGCQGAAVYEGRRVVVEPSWKDEAINNALQMLGATRSRGRDEFDSLSLSLYRDNDDWREAALASG